MVRINYLLGPGYKLNDWHGGVARIASVPKFCEKSVASDLFVELPSIHETLLYTMVD